MVTDGSQAALDHVFRTKAEQDVSWFELLPETSLQLLRSSQFGCRYLRAGRGGAIRAWSITWRREEMNYVTVLDVSGAASARARSRLGVQVAKATWVEADVAGE